MKNRLNICSVKRRLQKFTRTTKFLLVFIFAASFLLSFESLSFANQPQFLKTTVVNLPASGSAREISCELRIYNPNSMSLTVELPAVNNTLFGYTTAATPAVITLPGLRETAVTLRINLLRDGKYQVLIPLVVKNSRGQRLANTNEDLYFSVSRGIYTISDFRRLFANALATERDDDGSVHKVFRVLPPPANWRSSPEFDEVQPTMDELERMDRKTLYTTDWSERDGLKARTNPLFNSNLSYLKAGFQKPENVVSRSPKNTVNSAAALITAKGKLVYTGQDELLHPAYGWRVTVYAILPGGYKVFAAQTTATGNGNWEVQFPQISDKYKIYYAPRNKFFSFADAEENAFYRFTSGAVYTASGGGTINEFTQSVYSATSDLISLGELYNDGMKLWVTLLRKGGISPLRNESIVVYYPNNKYDCGHGDGIPWSCASNQGFIWLIPEHASGRLVMPHELAHQIHDEYWENDFDSGQHPPFDCTDETTAMVEGFADFIGHWVRFSKTTNPSGDWTFPVENPEDACDQGSENQLWVTATFWDLYDAVNDGNDTFSYTNQGSPIGIFLLNDGYDSMDDFRFIYMNSVSSSQNKTKIYQIFDQNHQDPF